MKNIQQLFPDSRNMMIESTHTHCLTGWIRLEYAPAPYMSSLLYACEYNEDLKSLDYILGMNILCLAGEHDDLEKLSNEFPASSNILLIKNDKPETVYTGLSEYFSAQCGIGLFADSLLEILSSEGGIQSMVDHAYYAFGNPIVVFDAGFNLIAANWEEARRVSTGTELLENKGFSQREFEMANSRNHIHARVQKSEVPILAYNPELGYDQLLL